MTELLPCVEVGSAVDEADSSVIWLHGLGADGHDFAPVAEMLQRPGRRFILPHSPTMPVTINNGMIMPAWFDILSLDPGARDPPREAESDIRNSTELIEALIEAETKRGIPAERIVLAGFSQGGAMALHVLLRHPQRLAGGIVLSAYIVLRHLYEAEAVEANTASPLFIAHGKYDMVVPFYAGSYTAELLEQSNRKVEWQKYSMGHEVCNQEIAHISDWLERVIPPLTRRGS